MGRKKYFYCMFFQIIFFRLKKIKKKKMEGIVDVYKQYFTNVDEIQIDLLKRRNHECIVCNEEPKNGSYGKNDKYSTEKIVIGYLEHLKVFGFSSKFANLFIDSVRDSGILCKKVHGFWEFKEHETAYVFIIEHSLDDKIEIPKVVLPFLTKRFIEVVEEKIKKQKEDCI